MMKPAALSLIVLIGLCSGCGPKAAPPAILYLPDCPAPERPALPALNGAEPLDSPANAEALMIRDDVIRTYINGLLSALRCCQARRNHGSD